MPDTLWEIFRYNRSLLGSIFNCAAQTLIGWAKIKGIEIGIFCAFHTYGRQLNWNAHVHLSVTRGGFALKPVNGSQSISKPKRQRLVGDMQSSHYCVSSMVN